MEVEDINTLRSKLFQTLVQRLGDALCLVHARVVRVALGRKSQSTVLPVGLLGESFLLSTNVCTGSVNLIVALRLKIVEGLVVVVDVGNSGSGGCIWASLWSVLSWLDKIPRLNTPKCHASKDDAGLVLSDQHLDAALTESTSGRVIKPG